MVNNGSIKTALLSLPLIVSNLTLAAPTRRQSDDTPGSTYSTRFENVTWDNEAWRLTTTNLDQGHYQSRISLANGYIGISLASLGPFFEYDIPVDGDVSNGWPLFDRRQAFATVGGFWDIQPELSGDNFPWLYQYGWVTAISGIPHWAGIGLVYDNTSYLSATTDSAEISNFTTSLDLKHGLMDWSYTWTTASDATFDIVYQMFLHKVDVNQAYITLNVTSRENTQLQVVNILDGDCALRTDFQDKGEDGEFLYSAVSPSGLPDIQAYVYTSTTIDGAALRGDANFQYNGSSTVGNNESSIASSQMVDVQAGQTMQVVKFVGIASSDAFSNPQDTARSAAQQARENGYLTALQSHVEEWERLFPDTSVDNYSFPDNGTLPDNPDIVEAQIMAIANPFYLLQNTVSEPAQAAAGEAAINNHSISVAGLGSDSYAGLIFWDAEVWMQPGLVAAFPYAAKGILNYRLANFDQAQDNIQTAYQSSKNDTYFSPSGAIYPWTSGRYGNCTATGPCWDYEYHLNGDIGLSMIYYWLATGDTDFWEESVFPVFEAFSLTLSELLQQNGSQWALTNMTDPDEFANHVDNGGFTMPLIAEILDYANAFREYFNGSANDTWSTQAENIQISRNEDANIILEYTGMTAEISVKQADVVLVTYPLSYSGQNYSTSNSLSDLDYYANKQSQDGPGMTYAIFSIVANEASTAGCSAYTYQQYSTQPYVRAPWFQFSEQLTDNFQENGGFHPAFPFLTGHGGANQVVLFGYLGLRYVQDWVLHIDPSLPPQIPYLRYRTFYWQGWPISAWSNQTHTTLSRAYDGPGAAGVVPNSTFTDAAIPVSLGSVNGNQAQYELPANGTVTVENRQLGETLAYPGNLGQCQPAYTDADIVPGQFAIGAVDGASSTRWQPKYANESAQLTVQLETGYKVEGFRFEWADAPPYNFSLWMHNDSSFSNDFGAATAQIVVQGASVSISEPFEPELVADIRPIGQNVSALWLNGTQIAVNGSLEVSELWTSRFVTLEIWGSQYNASFGEENMQGDGGRVAEFNVLVEGLN